MNKKQLGCMWSGIVIIIMIAGLDACNAPFHYKPFLVIMFLVTLVTVGLIVTFSNSRKKQ